MAIATNTSLTYSSVAIREDLSDVIYNIAPMDTPFLSGCAKMSADNTKFEWQTDTITAGSANRQLEGDDSPSATARVLPTRLDNYTQISRYIAQTSGTDDAVDYAGHGKHQAYQLAKLGKRMKRDMEVMLTQNIVKAAGDATNGRATAGVPAWINTAHVAGGASGSPTAGSLGTTAMVNNTSTAACTEANIKATIKECYDAGGQPDIMLVPSAVKQTISGLSSSAGPGIPARNPVSGKGGATAIAAVDIYVSDFGTFKIVPDRNLSADGPGSVAANVFFLDMDYWGVAWLRPFQTVTLAKTGDSDKQMLLGEYGLVSKNEKASGILASVS
jgi:hypothetical protein|tara:strand:- start:1583 stop:2572 length:990 start_codon:yes stop_codon:yes gene_type:complete